MKPITEDSKVQTCLFRVRGGHWQKGLLVNNGDSGIIDMNGNIPEVADKVDYFVGSDHTAGDLLILLTHFTNKLVDELPKKDPIVQNHLLQ